MIKSMTGFGRTICEFPSKNVIIEVKTLNSKGLDISLKTPYIYKEKEFEIRTAVSEMLQRGKIDCSIFLENKTVEVTKEINKAVTVAYYNQLKEIAHECGETGDNILSIVMRIPEVFSSSSEVQKLDEKEWDLVLKGLKDTLKSVDEFRVTEGKALEKDLLQSIAVIESKKNNLEPFEKERIVKYRQKITNFLEEYVAKEHIDQNRFEQELIFILEKFDINEEKVRLSQHCEYFIQTIKNEEQPGRKLGFIAQELGREINTIGSKSNDAHMQKLVVEMKDELERIKEQVLNVL